MTYHIGIVGHDSSKFTPAMEERAKDIILEIIMRALLTKGDDICIVSGGCHLGGIDIWAEEVANSLTLSTRIFLPRNRSWQSGYRPRNLQIASTSDIVHCIVVESYHSQYKGMRFRKCYHCDSNDHIKSGGCYTAWRCKRRQWHKVKVIE